MKVYNPLDDIPSTSSSAVQPESMTSLSSFSYSVAGVCPKCGAAMTTAKTHLDTVYWCGSCRVSCPLPDQALAQ